MHKIGQGFLGLLSNIFQFVVEDFNEFWLKPRRGIEEGDIDSSEVVQVLVVLVLEGDHFLHLASLQFLVVVLRHFFLFQLESPILLGQDFYFGQLLPLLFSHFVKAAQFLFQNVLLALYVSDFVLPRPALPHDVLHVFLHLLYLLPLLVDDLLVILVDFVDSVQHARLVHRGQFRLQQIVLQPAIFAQAAPLGFRRLTLIRHLRHCPLRPYP